MRVDPDGAIRSISTMMEILQGILLPAIVGGLAAFATIATGVFGYWNRTREQDIELVKIAVSVLSSESNQTSLAARLFALRTLKKYAGIEADLGVHTAKESISTSFECPQPNAVIMESNMANRVLDQLRVQMQSPPRQHKNPSS